MRWQAVAALLLVVVTGCSRKPMSYVEQMSAWRGDRDRFMRESSESPIPAEQRSSFGGLSYFPIDVGYHTAAALQPAQDGRTLDMPTSTGQLRKMRRVGTLSFTLKGQPLTLGAFVEAEQRELRELFVPFGDLTNGTETYPGGRYINLEQTATGLYELDFNRAYHPFCFFNSSYDCPYPPLENRLKTPIRAGEKLPNANR
jgi:uncharacterized protein (DUF1684 family)